MLLGGRAEDVHSHTCGPTGVPMRQSARAGVKYKAIRLYAGPVMQMDQYARQTTIICEHMRSSGAEDSNRGARVQ